MTHKDIAWKIYYDQEYPEAQYWIAEAIDHPGLVTAHESWGGLLIYMQEVTELYFGDYDGEDQVAGRLPQRTDSAS